MLWTRNFNTLNSSLFEIQSHFFKVYFIGHKFTHICALVKNDFYRQHERTNVHIYTYFFINYFFLDIYYMCV